MKRWRACFLILACLLLSKGSQGAVFEALGMGARSLAMGGSFVAVGGDYESVFWNPSGLGQIKEKVLHSEYRSLYGLGILRYMTSGIVYPEIGNGSLGFSWFRLDTVGDASYLDYAENTLVVSYGAKVCESFFLGMNGKYYRVNSTIGASGMGLDLGASYVLKHPSLTLGLAVQDLTRTLINWDSGVKERLPVRLRAGVSGKIFSETLLATQFSWQEDDKRSQQIHVGFEQELFKHGLALRTGGSERDNHWKYSFGIGLRVKALALDYGWEREGLLGDTQNFSLHLRF